MLVKNVMLHDAVTPEARLCDILMKDGKFAAIGENLSSEGEAVYDAHGLNAYPGLVEAHSHIGVQDEGMRQEGIDNNETSDPVTPQLRAVDSFYPFDTALKKAAAAGVTTVCTGPGSANVVGGTFIVTKTVGKCVDDMLVIRENSMKCAFGENPKRVYAGKGINARMTTAAKLRELTMQTLDYRARKEAANGDASKNPAFNIKYEAMLPVINRQMPLKAHAHRTDDILTAIRIAKEFDLKLTLEHCTEGHLIVDELVRAGYPVAIGPSMTSASKIEVARRTFTTPGILADAGLSVSILSDAPVVPQEYLALYAGLAVRSGMKEFDALRAITVNAARHIGAEDRVGSVEVGKDADLVLADGNILSNLTHVKTVFISGAVISEAK